MVVPKGWKKGFMPGELEPADADNFGSKTFGKTTLRIGTNCDGTCEKKDWAATADKATFGPILTGMKGKAVKDEKAGDGNGRLVVFETERDPNSPFGDKDVAVYVVRAWWTKDSTKYWTCHAELGVPAKGLAAAFEKVCAKVSE
jgi:hypothetical protein